MQDQAKNFPIEKMALIPKVSVSGYYAYIKRKPPLREQENKNLILQIQQIHKEGRCMYGSPRVHAKLDQFGIKCSRKRVARLMKQNNLIARMRKKWKKTHKHSSPKKQALYAV